MTKQQKYYGILMVRQAITPLVYVLKPVYVIKGRLKDDDDKKLVDDMGNEYYLAGDSSTVYLEIESPVGFLIKEDELLRKYPNCDESEARAKYYDEINKKVHFYSLESLVDEKVEIISIDLESLIEKKLNGDDDDKDLLSISLSENDGDEIVTITIEELKKLIGIKDNDELRRRLEKMYTDTMEMYQYFQNTGSVKKSPFDYLKKLTGSNFSLMFNSVCDEILNQDSLDEINEVCASLEKALVDIASTLEQCDSFTDEIKQAKELIYILIDRFTNSLKTENLVELKTVIKRIQCEEFKNVKFIGDVIDKCNTLNNARYEAAANLVVGSVQDKRSPILEPKQVEKAMMPFNVMELRNKLDRKVVGQEEAKIDVISALVTNHMKTLLGEEPDKRNAYLLVGPTGCGKTLIVTTVTKFLNVPFDIVDSTQLTIAGYVGANVEDCLVRLLEKANGSLELAQRGVIVFDEIDKKGTEKNGDVAGRGVLNTLLSFLQGTTYKIKYKSSELTFDTSRLTIFATGAFMDVVKRMKKQSSNYKDTKMGFGIELGEKNASEDNTYPELTKQDLCEYGYIPEEFIGRVRISQLNGHTKESLTEVLLKSESSPLFSEWRIFNALGTELRWTEGFADSIIERAIKQKTGGRALQDEIEKAIKKVRWLIMAMPGVYKCVILSEKTVENNLDCTIMDNNGESHNLRELYVQLSINSQEDAEKGYQKTFQA